MAYIFLDCEMGSVDLDYSLLSAYFFVTNDNFEKVDELELLVMPDDGKFIVAGEAMGVNKIDLYAHSLKAKTYKEAGTILYKWLDKLTNSGATKFVPVGHGVYGDIKFIQKYLISRGSWEKFTSYRKLDTSAVCQFLKACNMFPEDVSGSLTSLAKYFNIPVDENETHDAKYDTHLTFKVFMELRKELIEHNPNPVWT
jgi:hypothetical protein